MEIVLTASMLEHLSAARLLAATSMTYQYFETPWI